MKTFCLYWRSDYAGESPTLRYAMDSDFEKLGFWEHQFRFDFAAR